MGQLCLHDAFVSHMLEKIDIVITTGVIMTGVRVISVIMSVGQDVLLLFNMLF